MNYHNIYHDDLKNGMGLRVVVFLSGCSHNCKNCHNPQTHDPKSGITFDENAINEIDYYLSKSYTKGITLSGGDPLFKDNLSDVKDLILHIKNKFPEKDVWVYTGYTWEELLKDNERAEIIKLCDVVVDGPFIESLADENYEWAGSTNQRVIDVKKSLASNEIILNKK